MKTPPPFDIQDSATQLLLRGKLDYGEGEFSVAFCIHHDSIRVCPDSLRYNMCIFDTAIHLGARDEIRFVTVYFHPENPPAPP